MLPNVPPSAKSLRRICPIFKARVETFHVFETIFFHTFCQSNLVADNLSLKIQTYSI